MGAIIPAGAANGQTLYAQILSATNGQIANGSGLEAYNQANWADYVNAMAEHAGANRYLLTVPGYLPNGRYFAMPYVQLGASPAVGDTPIDFVFFDWQDGDALGVGSAINVGQIAGSATAATKLAVTANSAVTGAAEAGTLSTTQMTTDLTADAANIYAGRVLYFTSGDNAGRAALITAYAVTGGRLTFVAYNNLPISSAPEAGDTFVII